MGSQMVDRLLGKGHTVTGYNRTRTKAQWLIEKGMQWADLLAPSRQLPISLSPWSPTPPPSQTSPKARMDC